MVPAFIDAGADAISFHIETTEPRFTFPPKIIINTIKKNNLRCGIAIKPKTPFKVVEKYLPLIDYVVIMSVEPGFGGQGFIPSTLEKISSIDKTLKEKNLRDKIAIQVDGGIKLHNAKEVIDAGADILVAGSEVFKSENPTETIDKMYSL
ncbi:MAG: ribulose-phosphate 3-epimerase [Fidelibacterota bacterium]